MDNDLLPADTGDDSVTEGGHVPCGSFKKRFSGDSNGENWFQCCQMKCRKWFHLTCQGMPNHSKKKSIICVACKSNGTVRSGKKSK